VHNPNVTYPPIAVVASKSHKTRSTLHLNPVKPIDGARRDTSCSMSSNILVWEYQDGDNRVSFQNALPPPGVPVAGGVVETSHSHGELLNDTKAMVEALIGVYKARRVPSTKSSESGNEIKFEDDFSTVPESVLKAAQATKNSQARSMCIVS